VRPASIYDLSAEWGYLLACAEEGIDLTTGEEMAEDALAAAFASLTGDVEAKLVGCAHVMLRLKRDAEELDVEARRLAGKRARILAGRERLESLVRDLMIRTGTARAQSPSVSITLARESISKVEIVSPAEIQPRFLTVPVPTAPSPIMAEIKRALKAGESVPGARLVPAKRTLVIR